MEKSIKQFGIDILAHMFDLLGQGCLEEDLDSLFSIAKGHGLVEKVPFDKEKHGDIYDCDEGDSIWISKEEKQ